MEVVVTSHEMRSLDRAAIEKLKIPSLVLMENAGRGVVDVLERRYGSLSGRSFLVVCAKGNNGGDGFVAARHLFNRRANVRALLLGNPGDVRGDAKINYDVFKNLVRRFGRDGRIALTQARSMRGLTELSETDFTIDAVFGTGFSGEVRGYYREVIEWINRRTGTKISIDLPSGVNADNGEVSGSAVKADLTITMAFKKAGLLIGKGRECAGSVETIDVSIPDALTAESNYAIRVVHSEDVNAVLPERPVNSHKHSVGKIFVIAGSRGLTGAAAMTALASMRTGAGAVILGTPQSVYTLLAEKLTEVMVSPYPDTPEGSFAKPAYDLMGQHIDWADIIILGPGISQHAETQDLVWNLVQTVDKPLVIDADGLNALARKSSLLKKRKSKQVIITPHTGEFSRLIEKPASDIERDRIASARKTAEEFGLTVVLKGAPTVTATENGEVYINSTGNPGMATAGAGDVLAGMIGALWGQGMKRTPAAYGAVWLHGRAGDLAKDQYGERGMMAMDICNHIPDALAEVSEGVPT